MISYEQHRARVLDSVEALPPVSTDLRAGADGVCGLVLAADVVSAVRLPAFTNSAMDGYALRAADAAAPPFTLPVSGDIPAGDTRGLNAVPGQAWRIMTGAPVPEGADVIVPVEATDGGVNSVEFREPVAQGRHIRHAGEDVEIGDTLLRAGMRLAPHHIAVLASAGVAEVMVRPRPRVAVISTGDELRPVASELQHGQIHDSNGPMLAALVRAAGADVHSVRHLPDTEDAVSDTLAELTVPTAEGGADVIITTGGVSAGAFDVVKGALIAAGEVSFDKVAMQPGKPQGFGLLGARRVPVFTLPGNPMSTLVSFHVFVLPALDAMVGLAPQPHLRARVDAGWRAAPERVQFARVRLTVADDGYVVHPNTRQGSHHLGELADANALAVVPREVDEVKAGDMIDVIPLVGERTIR